MAISSTAVSSRWVNSSVVSSGSSRFSKAPMETPNSLLMAMSLSSSGTVVSDSHLLTDCRATPSLSPSSS